MRMLEKIIHIQTHQQSMKSLIKTVTIVIRLGKMHTEVQFFKY